MKSVSASLKSRLPLRALIVEALAGVLDRPSRTLLTMAGTILGVGAFVAVLGLTTSATGQISKRFTALAATEVVVEDTALHTETYPATSFPANADALVKQIPGVVNAGVFWTVPVDKIKTITGVLLPDQRADLQAVTAATPGFLRAAHPRVQSGRLYDEFHEQQAERVAVLGAAVAARLGITQIAYQPAIFIDGTPLTVIGIIDDIQRRPEVLLSVIVPRRTAEALWGIPDDLAQPARMLVETRLGAAQVVADQLAHALRPDGPDRFTIAVPPDPHLLRDSVDTDLAALFLLLAAVCLLVGAFGIANTTMVAVLERVPEIGLRRALGARPRHVAAQFLAESSALGALGGLLGAALGTAVVVGVALARQWTPIMAGWTVLSAPVVGTLTGMLAGLYPALRAASIEPAEALRR